MQSQISQTLSLSADPSVVAIPDWVSHLAFVAISGDVAVAMLDGDEISLSAGSSLSSVGLQVRQGSGKKVRLRATSPTADVLVLLSDSPLSYAPGTGSGGGGGGAITSVDLGVQAAPVATSDTGTFSVIALIKRSLTFWSLLLLRIPVLGPALMAASMPVTIASNQSAIPVTGSLTPTGTQAVSSVDLGVQADAAATSDTGTFSVIAFIKRALQNWTTLLARTPVPGQALMATSTPVVIASDQSPLPVTTTPGTLGQAVMAASAPVVIASDQSPIPVTTTPGPLGQAVMAASAPVVIASNQSAIPVTSSPGVVGQALMAASAPVVIASNQSPVPVTGTLTPTGTQAISSVDLGVQADAAATTDIGTFSVIAFIKRGMQNWTTLLARVPLLGQALMAASVPVVIASDQSRVSVSDTGIPVVARQLAAGIASASVVLTPTARRVILTSRLAQLRYAVGVGAVTANAVTSNYLNTNQTLIVDVPLGATIAAIRFGATNAVLEITELL